MISNLSIRAVQMDLARQPETVAFIKSSIDFYSQFGYNFLVLYLEGRIRTESFHAFPDSRSYSPEEVREIVSYALEKGLETIPVVSLFGHAEHFLAPEENEIYAELKNGAKGRFSTVKHVFCPSQPETLNFIEQYVSEVAKLFPSKYFHVGFDEVWDIGYCDICRMRLKTEKQSGIYFSHLMAVYQIVSRKLGKIMLMWDDLFDIYPEVLEKIPRDVILCAWHYNSLLERPSGHTGGPRKDLFRCYDRLGFQYIFAPASFSLRNIQTYTEYAVKYHPVGALLTVWEAPNACDKVATAYAGQLWSGNENYSMEDALRDTTPLRTGAELSLAIQLLKEHFLQLPGDPRCYFCGALNSGEYERLLTVRAARALYEKHISSKNDVIEELLIYLDAETVYFDLRRLLPLLCQPGVSNNISSDLAEIKVRVADLNQRRKMIEQRLRPDRMSQKNDRIFDFLEKMFADLPIQGPLGNTVLRVRYPEACSPFHFYVRCSSSQQWQEIEGGYTGCRMFHGENLIMYPCDLPGEPVAIRIDYTNGFTGARIMYAELETSDAFYTPAGIVNLEGAVSHPEALLCDGLDAAFFGDGVVQAFRKFNQPDSLHMVSSVEMLLKKEMK